MDSFINYTYVASAFLFVLGLKMMNHTDRARMGNILSALGMILAVAVSFFSETITTYIWIFLGLGLGGVIGAVSARRVQMTQMPEMVALFNGSGGMAALLLGWGEYHTHRAVSSPVAATLFLSVLIGGLSFSGSVIAWAKLREKLSSKPLLFSGQKIVNSLLLLAALVLGVLYSLNPADRYPVFLVIILISFILGVLGVLPVGGADMPVIISLLNSYTGIAAASAGFVVQNNILIVAGALVGASGFILTRLMCKAMNRSLKNVLFSGFGATAVSAKAEAKGEAKAISIEDAYHVLEAARSVVIVPGYGMAVAQAQHVVKELARILEDKECEVSYAIHPVAGRMPGHMNVLLAEADIPYDQLIEMDEINPRLETVDVCLVIGANDVVNPAARHEQTSPIYGMPIINADYAKNVFVFKRSMASGFAGIENPLFYLSNTRMIFGDAKASLQALVKEFKMM